RRCTGRDRPVARARRPARARYRSSRRARRPARAAPAGCPSCQVVQQAQLRLVREDGPGALARVLDDQRDLAGAEPRARVRRQREADEVDSAQLTALLVRVAALEIADDHVRTDRHLHVVARVDAEQPVEHQPDLRGFRDLDHQRRRQLTRPRQEPVYTSTSSAIFDSSTMRSARTISWIWNQTVARFSNTNVR